MKTVILAGGRGSRLAAETDVRPKPMVEIGGIPILVHIMRVYARQGERDFILALGYLGEVIKRYFLEYHLLCPDIEVNLATAAVNYRGERAEDWQVRMVDTGANTMTGGRLRRLRSMLIDGGTFMLTYGDGVANVDLRRLLEFHRKHGKIATVTAVRPPARFGELQFDGDRVSDFHEKPQTSAGWVNGGFFVFEPKVFDYLEGDDTVLEGSPLERLATDGELMACRHDGFWHPMDTVRDRDLLNDLWTRGDAPWTR